MEFDVLVKNRRSISSYKEEDVKEEDIKELIKCVVEAPSWKNSFTSRYYVACSKEAKEAIYDALPGFNQNSSKNASYIVCSFKKGISGTTNEGINDYWGAYDLGLANSYLVLKAKELGYDTLIMGLRDENKIRDYFKIPDDEMILPVIAIGKSNGEPRSQARKAIEEILVIK